MQVPPWVTGSFSEQVWRVDILRTAGPVYSNMDQEAAWKLRSLRLLRPQRTPPTPPGPPPAQPSPRPRRHFPEVVPAPLPGPADGTALTFRRNAILGLHCWPLCRIVILAPGTQNRDARDGRGSPRRARPRSRAQAERGCPPRPRPAPPGARIRAGQSARRARPGERCAGAHLARGYTTCIEKPTTLQSSFTQSALSLVQEGEVENASYPCLALFPKDNLKGKILLHI